MSTAALQRACDCGKKDDRGLQRRAQAGAMASGFAPPIVHAVLRGPGTALDERARPLAERILGPDFSEVRIHVDGRAAESATAVGALAYTVGPHIVFGAGRFAPGTAEGDRLLAHELAHVAQQGGAAVPATLAIGAPDTAFEAQAEQVATQVRAAPRAVAPVALMRAGECNRLSKNICRMTACEEGTVGKCIYPRGTCICRPTTSKEAALAEVKRILPEWLFVLITAAGLALIVACFATGICEAVALVAALGTATALLVIAILREAGVDVVEA